MSDNGQGRMQFLIPPLMKIEFQKWCEKYKTKPSIYLRQKIEEALASDDKARIAALEKEVKRLQNELRRARKE